MEDCTDVELVGLLSRGHSTARVEFFRRFNHTIWNVIRSYRAAKGLLRDATEMDDYQTIVVGLLENNSRRITAWHGNDADQQATARTGSLEAYIYIVARNLVRDIGRAIAIDQKNIQTAQDQPNRPREGDGNDPEEEYVDLDDQKGVPGQALLKRQWQDAVRQDIRSVLTEMEIGVITLDLEERSNQEIANILGIAVATVYVHRNRAHRKVRRVFRFSNLFDGGPQ